MATFTKRKGRVTATVRISPHPSKSKTFAKLRDAKAWAAATETELRATATGDYTHITLERCMTEYLASEVPKHRGARHDRIKLNRMLNELPIHKPLHTLDKSDFKSWRDERKKVVKGSTVVRDMSLLSAMLNWAKNEREWINANPLEGVARPKQPPHRDRVVSDDEVSAMLNALNYTQGAQPASIGQQVAVAMLLALETGMRAGEICGLTWDRVNLDEHYVHLDRTKNGSKRDVPLSDAAVELLELMQGVNDGEVFFMSANTLSAYFRKYRKRAGLGDFTFHDLRHTAATKIAKKLQIMDLCKMFGWKNPKQAMVYYNPTASEIAKSL